MFTPLRRPYQGCFLGDRYDKSQVTEPLGENSLAST